MPTTTIDITPTFSGLLPALLDARENMRRQLFADGCKGAEDGWCNIHDASFDEDDPDLDILSGRALDAQCETAKDARAVAEWKRALDEDLKTNEDAFRQMADLADRFGLLVTNQRGTLDDLKEGGIDEAEAVEALTTSLDNATRA